MGEPRPTLLQGPLTPEGPREQRGPKATLTPRQLVCVVGLVSGTLLAWEVALTRVLAVRQWSHFAYLAISVALLGFGASGAALALLGDHEVEIRGEAAWRTPLEIIFVLVESLPELHLVFSCNDELFEISA